MPETAEKDSKLTVRKALPVDTDLLVELGKRCFYEAFHEVTVPADLKAYLRSTFQQSKIQAQLTDDRAITYIAEIGSETAGYIYCHPAITPECVSAMAAIKLERLYMRKRYYGCGGGDALMRTAIAESRYRGYRAIWLSSWELNERANAFYKKWNFKAVGSQKFIVGSDIQNDVILSRRI